MNISDMKTEEMKPESLDMLEDIFLRQMVLFERYKGIERKSLPYVVPEKIPVDINSYLGQDQIKQRFFWSIVEISEALDCLKNKPWKQSMVEVDVIHFREEVADVLHFFIEGCLLAGISAKELYDLYLRKNRVNQFRQKSNY